MILPATFYPLTATRYPSPATRYPLPATRHPLPVTRNPLPVTRYPPPATRGKVLPKHGGQLWMNFSFIWKTSLQVQDIWEDGEFSKWLLSPLDQKPFQELVLEAVKNRKRSG